MTPRQPFPTVIDSSLVAAFRACQTLGRYDFFDHWKPKQHSVHLHAGAAYARGMEVARTAYYLGTYIFPIIEDGMLVGWKEEQHEPGRVADSMQCGLVALMAAYGNFQCPPESAKSMERTAGAYEYYWSMYPFESDRAIPISLPSGKRGIEFNFVEPIDATHPETGDPILYTGRMDMIVDYNGQMFGEDDKTTSQLGATWSRKWDLRSQFTGYCWGGRRNKLPLAGFIVRGVSILKTKYETQEAITYRPQFMIDEWYEQLVTKDVPQMIQAWESGKWGMNLDEACNAYGGCPFKQVCLASPENRDGWLRTSFERRKWDPVSRTETLLQE